MSRGTTNSIKQVFLVIDDHEAILRGTVPALQTAYPVAEVLTAQDIQTAQRQMGLLPPALIVLDLSLPAKPHAPASSEVGLHFLKTLIESKLAPNILVLSTNIQPLI